MGIDYSQFEKRKQDHIELALQPFNQTSELNDLDHIFLLHEALPDLNFDEISIQTMRFGQQVNSPFVVSSMTAGHQDALTVNRNLLAACCEQGWAMGVGSQRRELTDLKAHLEWLPLIETYPHVSLFSNLGVAQLIGTPMNQIKKLTDSLNAKAIIIHCNPLQECIQPKEQLPSREDLKQ